MFLVGRVRSGEMARTIILSTLLLVSHNLCAEALPRLQALGSDRQALPASLDMLDAEQFVLPDPTEYKNPKPLIGILSQACHYCPGK